MIKYLSLFSGIGAFEKAMVNQDIPFDLIAFSEIDKYASKAYSLIHGVPEEKNLGDITKIDENIFDEVDFITYGFPCQDISIAGFQKGLTVDGKKTRSGLFFDALRIITHTQPKVAIAENVKNLTSKKFEKQFNIVLESLESAGYSNYWMILNAKDYGVPQNRERIFIVSIRKDIDHKIFQFPSPYPLQKRLKDVLETDVDSKYFISETALKYMNRQVKDGRTHWNFSHHNDSDNEVANCLTANMMKGVPYNVLIDRTDRIIQVGNCKPTKTRNNPNQGRIYDPEGISPTLHCCGGGNLEPHIVIGSTQKNAFIGDGEISPSLTAAMGMGGGQIPMVGFSEDMRIRKLTPLECFRLMGFDDEDCEVLVKNKISNTQLYKMAGNSIVVDVAEELLCNLFDVEGNFFV